MCELGVRRFSFGRLRLTIRVPHAVRTDVLIDLVQAGFPNSRTDGVPAADADSKWVGKIMCKHGR